MTFQKGVSGNPKGRPRKAGPGEGHGEAPGIPEDISGLSTIEKAGLVEGVLWRWLRQARQDRDRSSVAREMVGALRILGELRRELKAHGDANTLIVVQQRDELRGELAVKESLWDAEMAAVVGALAAFPEARKSVLASLGRVRAIAEHGDRPGYPTVMALPAPAEAEAEAVPPAPGVAGQAPEASDVPLPTEKRGEPTAAVDGGETPKVGQGVVAVSAERSAVDGQGRPLPPRFGGYGDEPPWSGD